MSPIKMLKTKGDALFLAKSFLPLMEPFGLGFCECPLLIWPFVLSDYWVGCLFILAENLLLDGAIWVPSGHVGKLAFLLPSLLPV